MEKLPESENKFPTLIVPTTHKQTNSIIPTLIMLSIFGFTLLHIYFVVLWFTTLLSHPPL
jgi:hypothetical protein